MQDLRKIRKALSLLPMYVNIQFISRCCELSFSLQNTIDIDMFIEEQKRLKPYNIIINDASIHVYSSEVVSMNVLAVYWQATLYLT